MEDSQKVDKAILNSDSEDVYIRSMMQSLVGLTRASNSLPSAEGTSTNCFLFQFKPIDDSDF